MRGDVILTSCVAAAVAVCLQLVAVYSAHLLLSGPSPAPLQLTGIADVIASLRAHAAACSDPHAVDIGALDARYRRHMTFEVANLAGALRYFNDGRHCRVGRTTMTTESSLRTCVKTISQQDTKSNPKSNPTTNGLRGWNGRPDCVWLVGRRSACGRRLSLRPISLRQLCDKNSASVAAVCGLRRYKSVICVCHAY